MWLGEQITQRGIGNGISQSFTGIVAQLPVALGTTLNLKNRGTINNFHSFFTSYVSGGYSLYGFYRKSTKKNNYSIS